MKQNNKPEPIAHITKRESWQAAQEAGEYQAESLAAQGFIHCSSAGQVLGTANYLFRGEPGLVLLWLDPEKVAAEIRWEGADGQLFPHVYGPIDLSAVIAVVDFQPDPDGFFRALPEV